MEQINIKVDNYYKSVSGLERELADEFRTQKCNFKRTDFPEFIEMNKSTKDKIVAYNNKMNTLRVEIGYPTLTLEQFYDNILTFGYNHLR